MLIALTSLYPDDAEAHLELADLFREMGSLEKAADELETAIALNPFASNAYARLVLIATQLSQVPTVLPTYIAVPSNGISNPRNWRGAAR